MPFELTIPHTNGTPLKFSVDAGQSVFVLGANGTGKSSLMFHCYKAHAAQARRISAHRRTWFDSGAITITPEARRNTERDMRHEDRTPNSRWMDTYGAQRAGIALFDLVDAENVRARGIAAAVDGDDFELAKTLRQKDAPVKVINELLRLSNLPVEISVRANEDIQATKAGGTPYSIAQLSDGERNALLLAADVLTAKPGTLIIVDEPERHLHRSIISPLLTQLFKRRRDCAFIVSTHDVLLPLDNPGARTLLLRRCVYVGETVESWDADLVPATEGIDEGLKRDILGSRRKIIFVEGTDQSLDLPLYSLIFPNVSVIAKLGCRDVEHAVNGIRGAAELHWLHAFGIVDNDRRSQADIDRLKAAGIYAISAFAVESIYYHPDVQSHLASRHASVTGEDAQILLATAKSEAISAISQHAQRMSERTAERAIREEFFRHIPRRGDVRNAQAVTVTIDIPRFVSDELVRLQTAIGSADLPYLIAHYPVRETAALNAIAVGLGFQDRDQYETAVRKLLMDDAGVLNLVRSLFGSLAADSTAP